MMSLSVSLLRERFVPQRFQIIGVSGKARHGKDTVARLIAEELNGLQQVVRLGFADSLKEECRDRFGWNGEKDVAGRALLQRIGVERRSEDPLYWVRRAFSRMIDPDTLYVVSDVRFVNEADAIRTEGGRLWRVDRVDPGTGEWFDNGLSAGLRTHASETDLDGYSFDEYLVNDTIENLRVRVRGVLGLDG